VSIHCCREKDFPSSSHIPHRFPPMRFSHTKEHLSLRRATAGREGAAKHPTVHERRHASQPEENSPGFPNGSSAGKGFPRGSMRGAADFSAKIPCPTVLSFHGGDFSHARKGERGQRGASQPKGKVRGRRGVRVHDPAFLFPSTETSLGGVQPQGLTGEGRGRPFALASLRPLSSPSSSSPTEMDRNAEEDWK